MLILFNIFWAMIGMESLLKDVYDNYSSTRTKLGGKANLVGTPDQDALLKKIPEVFTSYLQSRKISDLFKVKGSIGNGNIANVPWVGLFRTDVTENAENGFYIVLLFSEDMSSCYLSLNQGITAIEKLYTKSFALRKMREGARAAVSHLDCDPEAWQGRIELGSTRDLGRAYEEAAIVSFRYLRNESPTQKILFEHLDHLVAHYERLYKLFGKNLNSLFTVSEDEFQQVVLAKAAQPGELVQTSPSDPSYQANGTLQLTKKYIRSPMVAAEAIRAAQFNCEIDPSHKTFVSRAKNQRYVEAHHLIPISQQSRFHSPLDIVANVVALCANCHRLLHYGVENDRRSLLMTLFKERKTRLLEKSINVRPNDFLRFYSKTSMLED
jgi:5-methylcytosine-specific restriction protein A